MSVEAEREARAIHSRMDKIQKRLTDLTARLKALSERKTHEAAVSDARLDMWIRFLGISQDI